MQIHYADMTWIPPFAAQKKKSRTFVAEMRDVPMKFRVKWKTGYSEAH